LKNAIPLLENMAKGPPQKYQRQLLPGHLPPGTFEVDGIDPEPLYTTWLVPKARHRYQVVLPPDTKGSTHISIWW